MVRHRIADVTSIVLLIVLVLFSCKIAEAVLEPAIFGVFIVILAWPVQKALQEKLGKAAALALTVFCTTAVVLALVSIVFWSVGAVAQWTRQNLDLLQDSLSSVTSWLESHDISAFALVEDKFSGPALVSRIQAAALRAYGVFAFSLVVVVYVILGLAEADFLLRRIAALPDRETSAKLLASGVSIQKKFRSYIVVRTVASVVTGLAAWALARFIGLELAVAVGVLTYALNYLPYIGSFVGVAVPPIFAFIQFGPVWTPLGLLLGLMAIHFVIGSLLEPAFSGAALSIAPPMVLFSILLWTFLWGPVGAFLGVPLAIALLSLLEQSESCKWVPEILSSGPPPAPSPGKGVASLKEG